MAKEPQGSPTVPGVEDLLKSSEFQESAYMVEGELDRYGHIIDIAVGRRPSTRFVRTIAAAISLWLIALIVFVVSLPLVIFLNT